LPENSFYSYGSAIAGSSTSVNCSSAADANNTKRKNRLVSLIELLKIEKPQAIQKNLLTRKIN